MGLKPLEKDCQFQSHENSDQKAKRIYIDVAMVSMIEKDYIQNK